VGLKKVKSLRNAEQANPTPPKKVARERKETDRERDGGGGVCGEGGEV
jgi:hypothetical protein